VLLSRSVRKYLGGRDNPIHTLNRIRNPIRKNINLIRDRVVRKTSVKNISDEPINI